MSNTRLIAPPLLALTVTISVVGAKDPPAPVYIATSVGDTMVFELQGPGKRWKSVARVAATEAKDGVLLVTTVITEGPTGSQTERTIRHKVSAVGVFLLANGKLEFEQPHCELRLPAKAGETWEQPVPGSPGESMKVKVVGEEEVEVPAGKFRAVKVEYSYAFPGSATVAYHGTSWFALGRGAVKVVVRVGEDEVVAALKSFTPASK